MKRDFIGVFICACLLVGCNWNRGESVPNTEYLVDTVAYNVNEEENSIPDNKGPFINRVSFQKDDLNGGYERYELTMDLYNGNFPDKNGRIGYGTLVLYVKSPDSTEGIEISRRFISKVYSIEENEARILMDNGAEKPLSFEATLTYNPEEVTYQLTMDADPTLVDDLMENKMVLQ